MLEISVLGTVEVRRDGELRPIPGGRTAELLVRLAVDAGSPVHAERLIDDLWGDDAPSTSRNTLQSKVARLRRALGGSDALVVTDMGYALTVERRAVDVAHVLDAAPVAAAMLERDDARGAADVAADALRRFRGDALAAAGDRAWVAPHRARLRAAHAALVRIGADARLRLGERGEVAADLEVALVDHPYDEGLCALLMLALYRAGRQADALAAFQHARTRLLDDLGLEPGPDLRDLEGRILRHDGTLAPDTQGADAPLPAASAPGNLPALGTALVGRDADIDAVVARVADHRLVTVVGPGGIGKTALALAVGRAIEPRRPVWLVRLESATDRSTIVDATIAALDLTGDERVLGSHLRAARAPLLIFDNCEHLLDEVADVTLGLLDRAPGLTVLCTSQAPLGLDGEALVDLGPLALADAVALFEERSRAHRRGRERPDDTAVSGERAVHELCAALDGLPLAIELAAARTRTLSVAEIARRLDDRFSLLNDPTSRRPARRRALGATIAWSYELLFPDDQRGLWALAAFPAGATLGAIEAVLTALDVPSSATLDVLDRLVTRSLVIVDETTPARYRLLDSVRAYATDMLALADATEPALAARAQWYREVGAAMAGGVRSRDQAAHLRIARDERANIDATLAWCARHDPLLGLTIAGDIGWAWVVLGDSRGAARVLGALDAAGDRAAGDARCRALLLASWLEASIGDVTPARQHIASATAIADALDDDTLRACCWYHLAYVVSHQGEFVEALALTDRSRAVYDRCELPWDRAANALFALRAATSAADEDRAIDAAGHAEEALRAVDDPWLHARHDGMRGEFARLQHRFGDAADLLARAAATSARLGFLQTEAYQVANLGRALGQLGDDRTAASTLEAAVAKAEAVGDLRMAALARVHLGRIRRALGDRAGAREALAAAAAWHADVGGGEQALLGDVLLAALDAADGAPHVEARLTDALDAARRTGVYPHVEVLALDALGRLAHERGEGTLADALARTADERMAAATHYMSERDRTDRVVGRATPP